jgi:hypothetical protein
LRAQRVRKSPNDFVLHVDEVRAAAQHRGSWEKKPTSRPRASLRATTISPFASTALT